MLDHILLRDLRLAASTPDSDYARPVFKRPEAARLALFMLSERGQAILARGGLLPLLLGQ